MGVLRPEWICDTDLPKRRQPNFPMTIAEERGANVGFAANFARLALWEFFSKIP